MDVVICGPNLVNQTKGQFHVHTVDCGDLDKMKRREPAYRPENRMVIEADSRQEIVEWLYDDHMTEEERDRGTTPDWREYDDIYLFPCLTALPVQAEEEPEEDDEEVDEDDTEVDESDDDEDTDEDTEVEDDDDDSDEDQEEDDDVPDPFEGTIELAVKHGLSDGKATAVDNLTKESLLGYLDDNLDDDTYGEMASFDLDRVVSQYVASFIKGFTDQCRSTVKDFVANDMESYLDQS
jgi:hypothetical protein